MKNKPSGGFPPIYFCSDIIVDQPSLKEMTKLQSAVSITEILNSKKSK